jgi:hypothetical protein
MPPRPSKQPPFLELVLAPSSNLIAAPNLVKVEGETFDWPTSTDSLSRHGRSFAARFIHVDLSFVRINQPSQPRAVFDPTLHLFLSFCHAVRYGEQLNDEIGTEPREACQLILGQSLQLFWSDVSGIWTQHRTVSKVESCAGIVDPSSPVGLPPGMELRNNFCISFAGKSSSGWVHQDLSFSGAFKMNDVVGGAERFELRIGQGRVQDKPARRYCIDGKKSTHSSMLPRLTGCRVKFLILHQLRVIGRRPRQSSCLLPRGGSPGSPARFSLADLHRRHA